MNKLIAKYWKNIAIVLLLFFTVTGVVNWLGSMKEMAALRNQAAKEAKSLQQAVDNQVAINHELQRKDGVNVAAYKRVKDSLKTQERKAALYYGKWQSEVKRPTPKYTNDELDSAFADLPKPTDGDTVVMYIMKQWRARLLAEQKEQYATAISLIAEQRKTISLGTSALAKADSTIKGKDQRIQGSDSVAALISKQLVVEKQNTKEEKKGKRIWRIVGIVGWVLLALK